MVPFIFSKYRLKLKIWPACTLDFFQIWNQKICEEKKKQTNKQTKKKKMTKQGLCKIKVASQQPSTGTSTFIFVFCFYFFFFLLFLLLLFLPSISIAMVSLRLQYCGFSSSLCLFCILFYVSKALSRDLHREGRKLLIFELKMEKCFSRQIFAALSP